MGIILSVPITAYVDASRRKKALEAANPPANDEGEALAADEAVVEEVAGEGMDGADGDFGGDTFGGDDFGGDSPSGDFDDDPFK